MIPADAILLYDGTCGFCATSVQFVLKRERSRRTLRFATLEGPLATELRRRHPWLSSVDSVVLYLPASSGKPERVLIKSTAALAVAAYVGGVWRTLATVARLVPRVIRDAVYDVIARYRKRLPMQVTCPLPTPEQRSRFIERLSA
jgi:predicted DCC family thiol-disulfide oxidoreductase YuxK